MLLSDRVYLWLKWISILLLPALSVLVNTVFPAWNIPYAEPITITLSAIGLFLGSIIGISNVTYKLNTGDEDE